MNTGQVDPTDNNQHVSPWLFIEQMLRRYPWQFDLAIAAVVTALSLLSLVVVHARGAGPWVISILVIAPLVVRRRFPEIVFVTIAAIGLIQWLLRYELVADVSLLIALYTVADERPRRTAMVAGVIAEVGVILATGRWHPADNTLRSIVFLTGLVAVAPLFGANVRARRSRLTALVERAERLELERDQQAQLSAAAERTRIAREMHDVVAHSLSVVIALADGATAKLERDPEQARSALHSVSSLGRQSLDDLRRLLGVLRTGNDGDSRKPQPGIDEIDALVNQIRSTGLDVTLAISGDMQTIAPGLALNAHRIVQEAITNALKHATNVTHLNVSLSHIGTSLKMQVINDGDVVKGLSKGGGFGLQGMRERAAIYDGTVNAGPCVNGGWEVVVSMKTGTERLTT